MIKKSQNMKKDVIAGLGEIGKPIFKILSKKLLSEK